MHRLALKIALVVAAAAGAVGAVAAAVTGSTSLVVPLITALAAGGAAWGVSSGLLSARLRRLESALLDIREAGGPDAVRRQSGEAGPGRPYVGTGHGGQDGPHEHGRQIGPREFGGHYASGKLTDAAVHPGDDEIDGLLRRADQAAISVRRRIAELKRAEHHRGEYVGDVSHELKTPIFAIQGFAETLLNGALDDRTVSRGFVEKILQNAGRLNALAGDLGDISRLEAGALALTIAPLEVKGLLEEVRESLELAARAKEIDVQVEVEADVSHIRGDRERISQVLANLVDNAIKYTDRGGRVRLRAEKAAPGFVRLAVIDNGIGIREEDIHRVTERFYRADKSRSRAQGGTGLGLAIVKHILAAHRTSVGIHSEVGRGSTFSFTLPAEPLPGGGKYA